MFEIGKLISVEMAAAVIMIGLGVIDWKRKRLSKIVLAVLTVLAAAAGICSKVPFFVLLSGLIPGVLFLIIGYLTREGIGYGDGWLVTILGFVFGVWETVCICLIALFVMACTAMIGMTVLHWNKDKRLAFVPYLAIGCVGVIII